MAHIPKKPAVSRAHARAHPCEERPLDGRNSCQFHHDCGLDRLMLKCEWSVALFSEVFKRQTMPYVNLIWSDLAAVPNRTAHHSAIPSNYISISYGLGSACSAIPSMLPNHHGHGRHPTSPKNPISPVKPSVAINAADRFVTTTIDHVPDDQGALKAALIEARAKLSGAEALIEHLQLVIAKMKRELFGPRSERSQRLKGNSSQSLCVSI
jgi:hypothetical protein